MKAIHFLQAGVCALVCASVHADDLPLRLSTTLEVGMRASRLTNGFGQWHDTFLHAAIDDGPLTVYVDLSRQQHFREQGTELVMGATRSFSDVWVVSGFAGSSQEASFLPRLKLDVTLGHKWLEDRSLITTIGLGKTASKDGHEDQRLLLAATWYAAPEIVLEAGARVTRSTPGDLVGTRPYFVLSWGSATGHTLTARYEYGREAWQVIGDGQAISNFRSRETAVTWRHWLTKDFGYQLGAQRYSSPNYVRRGVEASGLVKF